MAFLRNLTAGGLPTASTPPLPNPGAVGSMTPYTIGQAVSPNNLANGTPGTVNTGAPAYNFPGESVIQVGGRYVPNPFGYRPGADLSQFNAQIAQLQQQNQPGMYYQAAANPIIAQAQAAKRATAGDVARQGLGSGMNFMMNLQRNAQTAGLLGQAGIGSLLQSNQFGQTIADLLLGRAGVQESQAARESQHNRDILNLIGT